MERTAIIEISELGTRLIVMESKSGRYKIVKELFDEFPIGHEIENDQLLKPKTITKMVQVLVMYREMIQTFGVSKIVGVTSNIIMNARNQKGLFEQIYTNIGVSFVLLSQEDYAKNIFTALSSTVDASKAYGFYVGNYSSCVLKYNRRTVVDFFFIPFGVSNLKADGGRKEMVKIVEEELAKHEFEVDEGAIFVGAGSSFINLGRIAKKLDHYPIDLDNNYQISKKLVADVVKFIEGLELEKINKVKGLIGNASELIAGLAIIEALMNVYKVQDLAISSARPVDGLVAQNVTGEAQEKFTDLLGNSFDNYYEFHKDDFSNNLRVCNMSAILFKQLKVMHKLPRAYVKPMRIAAYMYDSGKQVNPNDYEKYNLYAIMNSGLCGASHKDLLLAGFIGTCQNPDNFSLAEWMKYKDLVNDEDLDAVRKLGVIVKLAVALNSTKRAVVNDVICDILGDSIIMKTVVSGDASYDILQGMKVACDYRKIFKKNLQII